MNYPHRANTRVRLARATKFSIPLDRVREITGLTPYPYPTSQPESTVDGSGPEAMAEEFDEITGFDLAGSGGRLEILDSATQHRLRLVSRSFAVQGVDYAVLTAGQVVDGLISCFNASAVPPDPAGSSESAAIDFSDVTTHVDAERGYLCHTARVRTTDWPPLAGETDWRIYFDQKRSRLTVVIAGAGEEPVRVLDTQNPHLAGAYFSVMIDLFAYLCERGTVHAPADPDGHRQVLAAYAQADPRFADALRLIRVLSAGRGMAAAVRALGGTITVTDSETADEAAGPVNGQE